MKHFRLVVIASVFAISWPSDPIFAQIGFKIDDGQPDKLRFSARVIKITPEEVWSETQPAPKKRGWLDIIEWYAAFISGPRLYFLPNKPELERSFYIWMVKERLAAKNITLKNLLTSNGCSLKPKNNCFEIAATVRLFETLQLAYAELLAWEAAGEITEGVDLDAFPTRMPQKKMDKFINEWVNSDYVDITEVRRWKSAARLLSSNFQLEILRSIPPPGLVSFSLTESELKRAIDKRPASERRAINAVIEAANQEGEILSRFSSNYCTAILTEDERRLCKVIFSLNNRADKERLFSFIPQREELVTKLGISGRELTEYRRGLGNIYQLMAMNPSQYYKDWIWSFKGWRETSIDKLTEIPKSLANHTSSMMQGLLEAMPKGISFNTARPVIVTNRIPGRVAERLGNSASAASVTPADYSGGERPEGFFGTMIISEALVTYDDHECAENNCWESKELDVGYRSFGSSDPDRYKGNFWLQSGFVNGQPKIFMAPDLFRLTFSSCINASKKYQVPNLEGAISGYASKGHMGVLDVALQLGFHGTELATSCSDTLVKNELQRGRYLNSIVNIKSHCDHNQKPQITENLELLLEHFDGIDAPFDTSSAMPLGCIDDTLRFALAHELAHFYLSDNVNKLQPSEYLADCMALAHVKESTGKYSMGIFDSFLRDWPVASWGLNAEGAYSIEQRYRLLNVAQKALSEAPKRSPKDVCSNLVQSATLSIKFEDLTKFVWRSAETQTIYYFSPVGLLLRKPVGEASWMSNGDTWSENEGEIRIFGTVSNWVLVNAGFKQGELLFQNTDRDKEITLIQEASKESMGL